MNNGYDAYQYLPEAEGVGQRFNLNALPNPPTGYRFLGYKTIQQASARRPQKADLVRWCEFYLWGFDVNLGNGRKVDLEKALRKLMYYTAPRHLPQNYTEFDACLRDAGPRLLDYTRIPWNLPEIKLRDNGVWYAPISRLFPEAPRASDDTQPQYTRPADAPRFWSDSWVEQALFSSQPKSNVNVNDESPADPAEFVDVAVQLAEKNGLSQDARREVQEAVQKAMMRVVYSDLERHSTAAARTPPQHMIAATEHDLFQAMMTSSRATSQVRLSEDDNGKLFINRAGQPWSIKGRGPSYSADSAVIDCVITVGSLLDAGSTNADRKDPQWFAGSNPLQQGFIELSDVNWDVCGRDSGARMKSAFREMILKENADFGDNNPDALTFLWNAVAGGLAQFTISRDEHLYGCDCLENAPTHAKITSHFITPEVNLNPWIEASGLKMQELFDRMFLPVEKFRCMFCQEFNARKERNFRQIPLRLAVKSQPGVPILEHNKDMTVKYREAGKVNKDKTATYRWLGGIYRDGSAYRVYWRTDKRGEMQTNQISMYDSSNHGLIVARSPTTEDDNVVPRNWIPELLFYERVVNPSASVLSEALHTISQMFSDETKGVLTLNNSQPWRADESQIAASGYPWTPQQIAKPPDAQRFQLASGAYIPGGSHSAAASVPRHGFANNTGDDNRASGAYDDLMKLYSPPAPGEDDSEGPMSPDSETAKRHKPNSVYSAAAAANNVSVASVYMTSTRPRSNAFSTAGPTRNVSVNEVEMGGSGYPASAQGPRYGTAGIVKKINVGEAAASHRGSPAPGPEPGFDSTQSMGPPPKKVSIDLVEMKSVSSGSPAPESQPRLDSTYSTAGQPKKLSVDEVSMASSGFVESVLEPKYRTGVALKNSSTGEVFKGSLSDGPPDPALLLETDAYDDSDLEESLGGSSMFGSESGGDARNNDEIDLSTIDDSPNVVRRRTERTLETPNLGPGVVNQDGTRDNGSAITSGSDEDDEDDEKDEGVQPTGSGPAVNQPEMVAQRRTVSQASVPMGNAGSRTGAVTQADSDITMEDRFELPPSAASGSVAKSAKSARPEPEPEM